MKKIGYSAAANALLFLAVSAYAIAAQGTEFTYQGRLVDNSVPANGSYDFEFALFAAENGGVAIETQMRPGVPVLNGIFTVRLDFGANFDGLPRWLAVSVRPAGVGAFTPLDPRQPISSSPYSIRSLNATNAETAAFASDAAELGGVAANQYVVTTDPRMTNARDPLPGSASYIQSNPLAQQAAAFNINGTGSANILNAATQFNIGGQRVLTVSGTNGVNTIVGNGAGLLSAGSNNSFFGRNSGLLSSGSFNSFFGTSAGDTNGSGAGNSFFGYNVGQSNTIGSDNAFFGVVAGEMNTTGSRNSFFGGGAGAKNEGADNNSFFGNAAGFNNESGGNNASFGYAAGFNNRFGNRNTFIGPGAGAALVLGNDNTFLGNNANASVENLTNATAIGANALVGASNTMVLGTGAVTVRVPGDLHVVGSLTANLPAGDGSYIQNRTNVQSGNANFNIAGDGTLGGTLTANSVTTGFLSSSGNITTATQYNVNGVHVLSRDDLGDTIINSNSGFVKTSDRLLANGGLSANGTASFNGQVSLFDTVLIQASLGSGPHVLCRNASQIIVLCTESSSAEAKFNQLARQITVLEEGILTLKQELADQQMLKQHIEQQQQQIGELRKLICSLKPETGACKEQ